VSRKKEERKIAHEKRRTFLLPNLEVDKGIKSQAEDHSDSKGSLDGRHNVGVGGVDILELKEEKKKKKKKKF